MPRRPKDKALTQPSVRVATQWTPSLIKAAFTQAEGGYIRSLAELCDNILGDDRVGAVFETRIGGLLGLDINFEASGDGRRRGRAVKALEAGEDWWAAFPETELQQFLTMGRLLGVSFAQINPTEHEGRFVPRIEVWHAKNTRYDWPTRQWFAKIDSGAREEPIEPGNGQWIVYTPYGAFRPWALGLWRGLARWWLLKSYAQDDAGRRSEKSGLAVVTDDEEHDKDIRIEIANDMFDAGSNGTIVFPKGFDAHMLESKETIAQNQGTIVDMANVAIAVSVLGQNLTTEVSGGSFAAAKVHNKVEIQRIRSDAETASTVLHDQALEWWAEFNFGDRRLAPWPIWATDPPTDQVERATVLKTLSEALAGFDALGLAMDVADIEADFGVKLKKVPRPEPVAPPQAKPPTPDQETEEPEEEPTEKSRSLASGTEIRAAKGFIEGQSYADALTARGGQRGAESLQPFISDLIAALDGIEDYESARQKVLEFYRDSLPPEELAERTERLFTMAQLAGMLAVRKDAGELKDGAN
jgi:phage gp29-like protein